MIINFNRFLGVVYRALLVFYRPQRSYVKQFKAILTTRGLKSRQLA